MTDEELKAIEARAEAATPGPWQADVDCFDHDEPEIEACVTNPGSNTQFLFTSGTGFMNQNGERERAEQWRQAKGSQELRDAAFIAASRTDVPALVKALREARAALDKHISARQDSCLAFQETVDAARAEAARWKERAEAAEANLKIEATGHADAVRSVIAVRTRAEAAEAELRKTTGFLADAERDMELLEDDIEEHLPSYLLDDGTNEAANHRERIEYAGADIRELTAKLTKAISPEAHAEVVRERDELHNALVKHDALADEAVALLKAAVDLGKGQLAEFRTHVALLREALGHVVDCKNLDLFSCSCGLARRALAATPSTASDELVALRGVTEAAREEHGARNREPECPICCALARLDALHGKGGA